MNWEALGAIAELLGAIGVIVTLLYLSKQIRHNSTQLEGSSTVAVHEYQKSMSEELCANPDLWNTVKKSNLDWDTLTEEEQANASLWNLKEAGFWEMTYRLHKQGALDQTVYDSKEDYYLKLYQAPGRRKWWDENAVILSKDFYNDMTFKLNEAATKSADFESDHPYWVKKDHA
ncbi:MAG: hypothetical protein AB8B95_12995 [Pseudohongiellaceae bacterium]